MAMRPIFYGNLEYEARQSDIELLFRKYGKVDRVDMKSGFAFVYKDDERDTEDTIRRLNKTASGRKRLGLHVDWTKQDHDSRRDALTSTSPVSMATTRDMGGRKIGDA
ncbi:RNA recognition motif domain [Dillenia turbinata]|uniref:RNA recognition motif domain n=1 Tax=Dillenia turbinata TaxID=194707 RepID=A0AAN8ZBQ8_9MAGN